MRLTDRDRDCDRSFFVPSSAWRMAARGDFWGCESGGNEQIHTHTSRFFCRNGRFEGMKPISVTLIM